MCKISLLADAIKNYLAVNFQKISRGEFPQARNFREKVSYLRPINLLVREKIVGRSCYKIDRSSKCGDVYVVPNILA